MKSLDNIISSAYNLIVILQRAKVDFEVVADEVEEYNLRSALNGISIECSIYRTELCEQFYTSGVTIQVPPNEEFSGVEGMHLHAHLLVKGNELHYICSKYESCIINAYKEFLNEDIPWAGLYELASFQLKALKCGFAKVKMLNAARSEMPVMTHLQNNVPAHYTSGK